MKRKRPTAKGKQRKKRENEMGDENEMKMESIAGTMN